MGFEYDSNGLGWFLTIFCRLVYELVKLFETKMEQIVFDFIFVQLKIVRTQLNSCSRLNSSKIKSFLPS